VGKRKGKDRVGRTFEEGEEKNWKITQEAKKKKALR
jgi:hypothetical protein